ncbi:MAG: 4-hydroxybenzoate octaprenyltransferase [Pirellulales bacterium]|nr:4-hydroxybenzoate octaprenyltransferase [Pirellulales bacterium]
MPAKLRQFLEMIRFSHTLFALPFALLAAAMAWAANARSVPPVYFAWRDFFGIVLCMVFARSAAMAFNRLADRKIDAENPRTQSRHLPAGALSFGGVAAFTAVCAIGFVASTLLFLPRNRIPLYASVPVLLYLFSYSYAKRFTQLAHFWLGTALALAPLAAWVAIRPEFVAAPLLLSGAVLFWVAGFDIIYACQDYEFDVRRRLHSIPARWGVARALRTAAACHLTMAALLALLPCFYNEFGGIYWTGVAALSILLIYEHSLVRPNDLTRVNRAFFHVNAAVSLGLLAVGILDLFF